MLHTFQERADRRAIGYTPGWVRTARWPTRLAWRLGLSWAVCVDVFMVTG